MLELKNIHKSFANRTIFKNLSLSFEENKVYAIIGKSGAGKTTLLNLLAYLEEVETPGEIYYQRRLLKEIPKQRYFASSLSYLFQNFGLIENESIFKNLKLGLLNQKRNKKDSKALMLKALSQVELNYLNLTQKIYELSGGEQQRVALAKAILKQAPVILADEPTAALDLQNSKEVMNLLISLKKQNRVIIVVTHNPLVWKMADEIINLDNLKKY